MNVLNENLCSFLHHMNCSQTQEGFHNERTVVDLLKDIKENWISFAKISFKVVELRNER